MHSDQEMEILFKKYYIFEYYTLTYIMNVMVKAPAGRRDIVN